MTKEEIIEQIENSFNEYKGSNEAIDDAAFYIASEFEKKELKQLSKYNTLLGNYIGTLKGILCWEEIPKELALKLKNKIKELELLK